MSYTQLPRGLFDDNKKQIKPTLPTNYKSEVLFSQLFMETLLNLMHEIL